MTNHKGFSAVIIVAISFSIFLLCGLFFSSTKQPHFSTSPPAPAPAKAPRTDSSASFPLTQPKIEKLATCIVDNAFHGPEYSWVAFDLAVYENPPIIRDEVARLFREKYVFYANPVIIPANKFFCNNCRDGFIFIFKVKIQVDGTVTVYHKNFINGLHTLGGEMAYQWVKDHWAMYSAGCIEIS